MKHYTAWYKYEGSPCSTTWAKNTLQQAGVVKKAHQCGIHRKRRKRAPWSGMMLHQDGRQHQWGAGQYGDLIVTMGVPEPAEGMTRPTSTTQCAAVIRKAYTAAGAGYGR